MKTLDKLPVGKRAKVKAVGGSGALRQHFLDMGVIPGVEIKLEKLAPMGDPMELTVHGYELTLRLDDAKNIEISDFYEKDEAGFVAPKKKIAHPGLGEGGKYHVKGEATPLSDDKVISFALVGNQNCGKTTLFNQLTGANRHVGNFPGVTVDRKSGKIKGKSNAEVTDLPGIYSLSPYSEEEIVSRNFILDEKPDCIINIVDATNIERNLYLTMQLMELDVPIVLALNMMDEVRENGGVIDVNAMESLLGIPVVPISASKNEGVDELINHALHIAKYQEKPSRIDFCSPDSTGGAVHRCLHGIMHLVEDHAFNFGVPVRFCASKLIEGDKLVFDKLCLSENEKEMIEHIIVQMEEERGLDRSASIADMRFDFIEKLCAQTVSKPKESKERARSRKIDKILTGKYTAIPSFILIMALVFFLTFNVIGKYLQIALELGIDKLCSLTENAFTKMKVNGVIQSLVIDGIFGGIGSVLSFIPIIVTLFFFLSLLEDSGYMARVAFVTDKLLRKIGLSGKSIVPMLMGFGCTVPAIMSTRTLSSERDRKMTIMLTPYMSCSAKLPIYSFIASAFFPKTAWIVMFAMYLIGIVMAIIIALIAKSTLFKGEAVPFVMELPNYRLPGAKNVARLLWDKVKDFIKRAFTVILIATVLIWFLQTFNFKLQLCEADDSMLSSIAGVIAPIFKPLGFGDYRVVTALISGFLAKESVVSTLGVLYGETANLVACITPVGAFCLTVFCLLYTPCVAGIGAVRRELGVKRAFLTVLEQCLIAYIVALIIRLGVLIF